jgi:DNA-binding GntR family transcriptional regulator
MRQSWAELLIPHFIFPIQYTLEECEDIMELEIAPQTGYQTKQEMVYHTLRNAIMRCTLRPGQRLVIEDIANQLKVSHIPVREALQLLQSEGLVITIPHTGATVAPIERDALIEIFTLMEGLELVATRIAATRLTPNSLNSLTALVAQMDAALQANDPEHWAELNTQFHRSIAQITGMPILQEMTERVLDHWDRVRRYFFKSVLLHRIAQAQQEHHAIVDAMQARDFARLEHLVKIHNQGALAAYMEHIAETG